MSKRVALIVDNPYRDLPGLALVATRLCQEGITCYLVPFNLQSSEIWSLAPDFVLLNYLRRNNERFAYQLAEVGIRLGVLDTEGIVVSLDDYCKVLAQDRQIRAQVVCYSCWGPRLAEHMVRCEWFAQKQVFLTGSPRYDFFAMPWRQAVIQASGYADRYGQNMVLLAGSFPLANPRFQSPEDEVDLCVTHFRRDHDTVIAQQQAQHRVMFQLTALANRLAHRFPKINFVYRPHPFERADTYEQLLELSSNLHLVKVGTVDGWILRSKAVIQCSCATAIDAGMAEVPTLSPAWIPPATRFPAADDVSVQCNSENELMEMVEAIFKGQFEIPMSIRERLEGTIHDWFFKIDGRAHERVAEAILPRLDSGCRKKNLDACRNIAYRLEDPGCSWRSQVRVALRKTLRRSVHWSFQRWRNEIGDLPWDFTEKHFNAEQVRTIVDAIQIYAKDFWKGPQRKVGVRLAQERGDYRFGYLQGRSVTLFPQ